MKLPPPFDSVQLDVERSLHDYLHVTTAQISQVIIVGAYGADEVERMHMTYPNARFLCFEPNPATNQQLQVKFANKSHVTLSRMALGSAPGKTMFHELSMPGTGSLLEPDLDSLSAFCRQKSEEVAAFEVNVSTLDLEAKSLPVVDLLWMDVQGAEGKVLEGGAETLKRTKSVFLEIALASLPYQGAALFPELAARLQARQFTCVGLGVDAWNGTGNAFFVKDFGSLICKQPA